jgi:hypothetical protein
MLKRKPECCIYIIESHLITQPTRTSMLVSTAESQTGSPKIELNGWQRPLPFSQRSAPRCGVAQGHELRDQPNEQRQQPLPFSQQSELRCGGGHAVRCRQRGRSLLILPFWRRCNRSARVQLQPDGYLHLRLRVVRVALFNGR